MRDRDSSQPCSAFTVRAGVLPSAQESELPGLDTERSLPSSTMEGKENNVTSDKGEDQRPCRPRCDVPLRPHGSSAQVLVRHIDRALGWEQPGSPGIDPAQCVPLHVDPHRHMDKLLSPAIEQVALLSGMEDSSAVRGHLDRAAQAERRARWLSMRLRTPGTRQRPGKHQGYHTGEAKDLSVHRTRVPPSRGYHSLHQSEPSSSRWHLAEYPAARSPVVTY